MAEDTAPEKTGTEDSTPSCCACCCCSCCQPDKNPIPEHLRDGDITSNRSCTDCPMTIIYTIFLIGWFILLGVAIDNGKPDRILFPENFRGDLCGEGRLSALPAGFWPLPQRTSYSLCVRTCPAVGDIVCNNDVETSIVDSSVKVPNHDYSTTASGYSSMLSAYAACKTGSCTSAQQTLSNNYIAVNLKLQQRKCFIVFYPSGESLRRCIPGKDEGSVNDTLRSIANESAASMAELSSSLGVGSFFTLGFGELLQTWPVILIAAGICMVMACLWVILLRWILAPLVYIVIILIFGVIIALGFIFKFLADDLENNALPGEKGTDDQVVLWRVAEYACWILAAMYFVVMLYMIKRIRIAIAVMEEASKAFMSTPSMILIPIFTFIFFIGFVALFVVTTIYIQTIGSVDFTSFANSASSLTGNAVNVSKLVEENPFASIINITGQDPDNTTNATVWTTGETVKILHAYNIFAILWTGNFMMCLGFFVMSMTVCSWYFSATQAQMRKFEEGDKDAEGNSTGKEKSTPVGILCKSLTSTLWYHLGTVLWGALLIAIIQFIRAVFTYISETYLKDFEQSTTGKIVLKCVQCCLWYIEHVIRVISKNAFIISVIRSTNFCSSAAEALAVIVANAARISILSMLSTATIFLIKAFIVGATILISYALLDVQGLTDGRKVDSGLFPIFVIGLISFAIAALFMNVYEACIDTIFMAFLMDEKYFKGEFMPESLAKIVDLFKDAEEARLAYEKQMASAMKKSADVTPKPDAGTA